MYAVIKTGGKQHKVKEGDVIFVEKMSADAGKKVTFSEVMMLDKDNQPLFDAKALGKASVTGTVVEQTKGDKVTVFKYKSKKGYKVKQGHRQDLTKVKIDKITTG